MSTVYNVALIGSSGGGAGTVNSGDDFISTVKNAFKGIDGADVSIKQIQFITCHIGLDNCQSQSSIIQATLHTSKGKPITGTLTHINKEASKTDAKIAKDIKNNKIHAIISISSDPGLDGVGVNKQTVDAAILMCIPFVGTGGTSMSYIAVSGGSIIGTSGGSIATTANSRALCFASSLAAYWKRPYKLVNKPSVPMFRSVCGGVLPILITTMLTKYIIKYAQLYLESYQFPPSSSSVLVLAVPSVMTWLGSLDRTLTYTIIPISVSAMTCLETSKLSELSLLAGVVLSWHPTEAWFPRI